MTMKALAATACLFAALLLSGNAGAVGVSGAGNKPAKPAEGQTQSADAKPSADVKPTSQSASRLVPRATDATRRQMSVENLREASIRNGPIKPTIDQSHRQNFPDPKTLPQTKRIGELQVQWKDEALKADTIKTIQQLESNGDRAIIAPAFAMNEGVAEVQKLEVKRAEIGMKPTQMVGWLVTGFFIVFIAFYAAGPGVCVWLALSELMPTRIRANGMAIALLINQLVSTTIAGTFLPWVGAYGYSSVFFTLAGFTVIYFITAAFFMPETKGRTLEEIEQYFTTGKMPQ